MLIRMRVRAGLRRCVLLVPLLALLGAGDAQASIDSFEFSSPQQAERYQALIAELRCPVCLSSNLSGSDSPISADLRREVYRLVEAGKSDDEIRAYMYERYGDYILYRPRLTPWVILLYAFPALLVLGGVLVIVRLVRDRSAAGRDILEASADSTQSRALDDLLARHTPVPESTLVSEPPRAAST